MHCPRQRLSHPRTTPPCPGAPPPHPHRPSPPPPPLLPRSYVGGLRRLTEAEREEWRRHGAPSPPAPAALQALAEEAAEEDWSDEEEADLGGACCAVLCYVLRLRLGSTRGFLSQEVWRMRRLARAG